MSIVAVTAGNATMRICNCTGQCRANGQCGVTSYSLGSPAVPTFYCACPCHGMHWSVYPPQCWCNCRKQTPTDFNELKRLLEANKMDNKIEKRLQRLESLYNKFEETLAAQLDHLASQSQKREALRSEFRTFYVERFKTLEDSCKNINERVKESLVPFTADLSERMRILEELFNEFNNKSAKLASNIDNQPFKCPLCMGKGKVQTFAEMLHPLEAKITDEQGRHWVSCKPCKESGILWG